MKKDIKRNKRQFDTICNICGYEWNRRKDTPVKCPACQSRDWNKKENDKNS